MPITNKGVLAAHAAQQSPERKAARRLEADRRLREYRNRAGSLRVRLQPYVWTGHQLGDTYKCLPGTGIIIDVDEAIDVHDLMADTIRFWKAWRPARRRTDTGQESVRRFWDLVERAANDLKP